MAKEARVTVDPVGPGDFTFGNFCLTEVPHYKTPGAAAYNGPDFNIDRAWGSIPLG